MHFQARLRQVYETLEAMQLEKELPEVETEEYTSHKSRISAYLKNQSSLNLPSSNKSVSEPFLHNFQTDNIAEPSKHNPKNAFTLSCSNSRIWNFILKSLKKCWHSLKICQCSYGHQLSNVRFLES